jgi:hypothetical protein
MEEVLPMITALVKRCLKVGVVGKPLMEVSSEKTVYVAEIISREIGRRTDKACGIVPVVIRCSCVPYDLFELPLLTGVFDFVQEGVDLRALCRTNATVKLLACMVKVCREESPQGWVGVAG